MLSRQRIVNLVGTWGIDYLYILCYNAIYATEVVYLHRKEVVRLTHKLSTARIKAGLTICELASQSGISKTAIYHIENENSPYKINDGVAKALAAALKVEIKDLFDPIELSNRGRPPHTGKSCQKSEDTRAHEIMCPKCFVMIPLSVECDTCGWVAAA